MKALIVTLTLLAVSLLGVAIVTSDPETWAKFAAWKEWWGAVLQAAVGAIAAFFAYLAFRELRRQVDQESSRHDQSRFEQRLSIHRFFRSRASEIRAVSVGYSFIAEETEHDLRGGVSEHDPGPYDPDQIREWAITLSATFSDPSSRSVFSVEIDDAIERLTSEVNRWNRLIETAARYRGPRVSSYHWSKMSGAADALVSASAQLEELTGNAIASLLSSRTGSR
jgi:hypothetical protein